MPNAITFSALISSYGENSQSNPGAFRFNEAGGSVPNSIVCSALISECMAQELANTA